MGKRFVRGVVLALAAALLAGPGCTYLRNRGRDAAQMGDLGLTFSKKPQFGLYMNCPVIVPIGYGKVDGYYAGVGRGKVGVMQHQQRNAGAVVWGYERNTWQDPAKAGEKPGEKPADKAVEDQPVGLLAIARGERGEEPYRVSCKHYFHLGWVGITANICWLEIPDFFLGWFLIDLSGDDAKGGAPPQPAQKGEKP